MRSTTVEVPATGPVEATPAEEFEMGHAPEFSAQCLIGKCGACPDPDCECTCHPDFLVAPPEVDDEWKPR